jgi:hypothetical protein
MASFFKLLSIWNKNELPQHQMDCITLSVYNNKIDCK